MNLQILIYECKKNGISWNDTIDIILYKNDLKREHILTHPELYNPEHYPHLYKDHPELWPDYKTISSSQRKELYGIWYLMIRRCKNEKDNAYKYYGGRGIKVCDRWENFKNFLADMGPRPPGLQIDRIDTNGNYEHANCKWVTPRENVTNTRRCKKCSVSFVIEHNRQKKNK